VHYVTSRLKKFKEIVWEDEKWINLSMEKYRWRAVINSAMNIPVP
jgi:hypothetical protein